jgi:hypothetical protein
MQRARQEKREEMAAVTIATNRTPIRAVAAGRAPSRRRVRRATYVRRRLSVVGLAVGLVLVTAQAGAALGGSSPDAPGRAPTVASTVVGPGDSLWSVAERLAPGDDPRPVVDALREARHGDPLLVGETVRWGG